MPLWVNRMIRVCFYMHDEGVHLDSHVSVCVCVHVHVCMRACMCVRMRACMHALNGAVI
jgi:hypothetical protein